MVDLGSLDNCYFLEDFPVIGRFQADLAGSALAEISQYFKAYLPDVAAMVD